MGGSNVLLTRCSPVLTLVTEEGMQMKRYTAAALLLAAALAAGCAGRATAPGGSAGPGPKEPDVGQSQVQDLERVADPSSLNTEELRAGLEKYVNKSEKPASERLADLFDRWGLKPVGDRIPLAEADLNGDGTPEVVTALVGQGPSVTGKGALFVLYRAGDGWQVDRSDEVPGPALHAVADLTGDGLPEIIWSSTDAGAHTSFSTVLVSTWKPGALENLPGSLAMASMELAVEGQDLLLRGGLIGSVGAGEVQRVRTDRYRFDGEQFRLVDRRYAVSDYGYHRLVDGILAEEFGRMDDARQAFREAMEPGRAPLKAGLVPAEWEGRFGDAVRAYAAVRLALNVGLSSAEAQQVLAGAEGAYAGLAGAVKAAGDEAEACQAAAAWAEANPEFLEALNSPEGYAHPHWLPADLCGPLPPDLG